VLCAACYEHLNAAADAISKRFKNWAGGTKHENLKGCRTQKEIGRIEENGHMEDPEAVAHNLKIYAAQIGGNGYVRFFYERHQERNSEQYVAGYGKKGNPYYRTKYWTEVWYTGYATAIWAERQSPDKNRQLRHDDEIVRAKPWRKPRRGDDGSSGQSRWTPN
jgi:hypothetical protein